MNCTTSCDSNTTGIYNITTDTNGNSVKTCDNCTQSTTSKRYYVHSDKICNETTCQSETGKYNYTYTVGNVYTCIDSCFTKGLYVNDTTYKYCGPCTKYFKPDVITAPVEYVCYNSSCPAGYNYVDNKSVISTLNTSVYECVATCLVN